MTVNFDNAATSFPKPPEVRKAVIYAMDNCGGSAGRGGHIISAAASETVYRARETAAGFFDAKTENTVFCSSCTHALNTAIKGTVKYGSHVVTSSLEHNSVIRPLIALRNSGKISLSIAKVYDDDEKTVRSFREAITPKTKTVICTIASNVTGQILPIRKISEICRRKNICLIADGAQACGIMPVSLKNDGINILCTSGHKGLYGIAGTGLLISDGKYRISPLMQGGTGSISLNMKQPDIMPDCLESGTLCTVGIASVKAGMDFINRISSEKIRRYEEHLADVFLSLMEGAEGFKIYRPKNAPCLPLLSFNALNIPSEELASYLNGKGFCLRAGFHCSALAHRTLGTKTGTVRFAPSVFNREEDVKKLCSAIKNVL